jgi:tRNA(Ile)-lysidine synthase
MQSNQNVSKLFLNSPKMKQIVKDYIDKHCLLKPKSKVIVGLSGGADSVTLLHILHRLDYTCFAAHCNFHLREEESDRDEQFAASFADSLNVSFFKQDFDTQSIAKKRGISIEMAARDLRYQWFSELQENQRADAIAVAHHKDDSIETLLLNLIRGTGIKGLTGIQPRIGCLVRPLLCVSRKEILQYVEKENLSFITDSSNKQDDLIRNKIRLQVIPLLETINPSVREAIVQTMDNLNETLKIYDAEIEKAIQAVYNQKKGNISIPLLKTFPSPESILFELLKNYGFGKEVIREIYHSMDSQAGKTFYAPEHYIVKDRNEFFLSPIIRKEKKEYLIQVNDVSLEFPVRMEISLQVNDASAEIDKNSDIACLDYDKLHFPLTLRRWKIGDKFIPLGMNSFQKLSDFFTNRKFSKIQKEKTWILTSGKEIVWVVNHRLDERFKVKEYKKNRYILKLL